MLKVESWVRSLPRLPSTFAARRARSTVERELGLEPSWSAPLPNLPDPQPFAERIVSNKISQSNSISEAGRKQFPLPFVDLQRASSEVRFTLATAHTSDSNSLSTLRSRKLWDALLQEEHNASTSITTAKCMICLIRYFRAEGPGRRKPRLVTVFSAWIMEH